MSIARAWEMVQERGPRWAVRGSIRAGQARAEYADTAEQAETIRERFEEYSYYQVQVYPPLGGIDLAKLGRTRQDAQRALADATSLLRAGVLRALEEGRSEAEVARSAGVDRMTVRSWAGKR
jgi:DNA-directed RNA polymerase specialized sigma24 family protein